MLTPKVTVFLALSPVSGALSFPLEPTPRFPFLGGVRKGAGGAIISDEACSTGDAGEASPSAGEAAFFPRFFFFFFWDEEGDASCFARETGPDTGQGPGSGTEPGTFTVHKRAEANKVVGNLGGGTGKNYEGVGGVWDSAAREAVPAPGSELANVRK